MQQDTGDMMMEPMQAGMGPLSLEPGNTGFEIFKVHYFVK